jgi:hypothetical protein
VVAAARHLNAALFVFQGSLILNPQLNIVPSQFLSAE